MPMMTIPWLQMTWLNPPEREEVERDVLEVITRSQTDFWRTTAYGFVHDDGPPWVRPLPATRRSR